MNKPQNINPVGIRRRMNKASYHSKIVGVNFEGRQEVIARLDGDEDLRFRREPENEHDANAVAVDALVKGSTVGFDDNTNVEATEEWIPIGYIAKDKNSELAMVLDEGKRAAIKISEITGGGDKNYGVNVYIEYEKKRKAVRTKNSKPVKDIFGNEIFYDDDLHQYTNTLGEIYLSGSKYAEQFSAPFPKEIISNAMAKKAGLGAEHAKMIQEMWALKAHASASLGTGIHAALELYGRFKELSELVGKETFLHDNPVLKKAVLSFYEEHPDVSNVKYEALVVDHSKKRAGRIDRLEVDKDGGVWVTDFKGLHVDTPIPTPSGFTTMGELLVGDTVFDRNGDQCKVKNKSSVHYKKCYKIVFSNGQDVIADHDHKWVVAAGDTFEKMKDNVVETSQLGVNDRIIIPHSIKTTASDLPIDPYVLGLWLADGSRTAGTITCTNDDIWMEVGRRGYVTSVDHNRNNGRAESRTLLGLKSKLKSLGLIGNKHVPSVYMFSSYDQRLDLLRGYFDGDGYWNRTRSRYVMNTTSTQQVLDVVRLVSSLGVQASVSEHKVTGFGIEKVGWYISFAPVIDPFLVRSRGVNIVKRTRRSNIAYIKSIEVVDTVPTQCIEVDSPTSTYLFGDHFMVTHNTNADISTKLKEYWLQLSFYSAIIKANGLKVKGLKIYHFTGDGWNTILGEVIDIDKDK